MKSSIYRESKATNERSGGCMPTIRTTYPLATREALATLAESNPTPAVYASERARILAGT